MFEVPLQFMTTNLGILTFLYDNYNYVRFGLQSTKSKEETNNCRCKLKYIWMCKMFKTHFSLVGDRYNGNNIMHRMLKHLPVYEPEMKNKKTIMQIRFVHTNVK